LRSVRLHIAATLALVLVCAAALPAGPKPRILLDITVTGRTMPLLLESTAMKEARLIWSRYGVDLRPLDEDCPGREGAVHIQVVLADRASSPVPDNALGSIVFEEGAPNSLIVMYPDAIAALVSNATMMERHEPEWPTILRHIVLGRAMGRALAHEVGHFLLRSRDHAPTGLMRASHSITDLIAVERFRFTLSANEVARLTAFVPVPAQ
jgi:hypothetical protein